MNSLNLNNYRCECGRLLLKGIFFNGTLQIKCRKCRKINNIGFIKKINDNLHYVFITDNNGVIVNVNDSACQILGYNRDELIGQNFTLINPNIPKELIKKFFGVNSELNEENYFKLDTNHKTKDGKIISATVFLKLYKTKGNEKYFLILARLEKPENDEKPLIENNDSKFFDNACDFFFDIDKNGTIEYVSPSIEKSLEFLQESIIGKNCFDFIPVDRREKDEETFNHFCSNRQSYRVVQDIILNKKGKIVDNELYFTSCIDDYGNFIGYRVLAWIKKGQN